MSVINTMLRDLEQRSAQPENGRYQPPVARRSSTWLWVLLALLVSLPGVGYLIMSFWHLPSTPPVVPAVQAVPAAASVSAAALSVAPATIAPTVAPQAAVAPVQPVVQPGAAPVVVPTSAVSEQPGVVKAEPSANRTVPAQNAALTSSPTAAVVVHKAPEKQLEDTLLGPDAGPQPTEASQLAAAPVSQLAIHEEQLSPQQEAALQRKRALQSMSKGQLAAARDAFSLVLVNEPQDINSRERLAGLLYGEGRLSEARDLLTEGIRIAPKHADFRLMQARIWMTQGNRDAALQTLAGYDPAVGPNQDYYATRAALAQELGQIGVAARSYQALTEVQPNEGRWWLGLGIAYDKQGRTLAAQDAYRAAQARALSDASRQFVQHRLMQLEHK